MSTDLNVRKKMETDSSTIDERLFNEDGHAELEARPYFITICTHGRQLTLGSVHDGQMVLNNNGNQVEKEWLRTGDRFAGLRLDAYSIMPNHFHAIVWLAIDRILPEADYTNRKIEVEIASNQYRETEEDFLKEIIDDFKTAVTNQANGRQPTPGNPFWQPSYHGHVIGNPNAVPAMRRYVNDNPVNWSRDLMNPLVGDPSCLIPTARTSYE
jgi:REP element-mobilizing transposase RayT